MPIVSIVTQSVFAPHEAVLITTENCGPFGCQEETTIDQEATAAIREAEPLGRFVGLDIYKDRGHLAFAEVGEAWNTSATYGEFFDQLGNLPFYRAIGFTLSYTAVVTPCVILLGLMIALVEQGTVHIFLVLLILG